MTQRFYFDVALKQSGLTEEAETTKARIEQEFINRYYEWRKDITALTDMEYGWKYGYGKPKTEIKDNLSGVTYFQKYGFSGRWMQKWQAEGYDRFSLWELIKKGFLSCQEYSNYQARGTGHTEWVYISQSRAKEIYKAYKA